MGGSIKRRDVCFSWQSIPERLRVGVLHVDKCKTLCICSTCTQSNPEAGQFGDKQWQQHSTVLDLSYVHTLQAGLSISCPGTACLAEQNSPTQCLNRVLSTTVQAYEYQRIQGPSTKTYLPQHLLFTLRKQMSSVLFSCLSLLACLLGYYQAQSCFRLCSTCSIRKMLICLASFFFFSPRRISSKQVFADKRNFPLKYFRLGNFWRQQNMGGSFQPSHYCFWVPSI